MNSISKLQMLTPQKESGECLEFDGVTIGWMEIVPRRADLYFRNACVRDLVGSAPQLPGEPIHDAKSAYCHESSDRIY
jgi:hypothetical protein